MGSGDVKVGEVGRVGLVKVVVDFEEGRVGGGDDRLEEDFGRQRRGLAREAVVDKGVEYSILFSISDCNPKKLAHDGSYRPREWHRLPVKHHKYEQQDARRPTRTRQELLD